ncbi:allantoate deiminase [Peribacillus kribbensis]|uniref:allantoate deiminase n=1 Tax=Peribacillus kribbensis TaxID=356658 RepID=UPI0004210144|nr:allantoate deiminase [Peribacillus kribbensis]
MVIQVNAELMNKRSAEALVEWLGSFGRTGKGGVTRLLYTKSWKEAQQALKNLMEENGLPAYYDCIGNLFGRLQGTETPGRTILTGSHIDTVIEGGKYDGAYGIIASFIAVLRLAEKYGPPKKSIEVVSLCEEEGSRFPLTFWGSRNITGSYDLDCVKDVKDSDGMSFMEAMKEAGFNPQDYSPPIRNDIDSFVEIHIEQGMTLERNGKQLGVVSHISGQRRYTVLIKGESNHAGTTPMPYRKDALTTAARFITFLTEQAGETDPHLVATVGRLTVRPNVSNVIAGEVEFTLDIRHHQEPVIDSFCHTIFKELKQLSVNMNTEAFVSLWMDAKPVKMDSGIGQLAMELSLEKSILCQKMISGAGHDSQIFGQKYPACLLFVPSQGGISHSPEEFTKSNDLEAGIDLLTDVLHKLAY